jgi:hypothetical protein
LNQQLVGEALQMVKTGIISKMEIQDEEAKTVISRNKKSGNIKISVKQIK